MTREEFAETVRNTTKEIEAILQKNGVNEAGGYLCTVIITAPEPEGMHIGHVTNAFCPSCHAFEYAERVPCVQEGADRPKH